PKPDVHVGFVRKRPPACQMVDLQASLVDMGVEAAGAVEGEEAVGGQLPCHVGIGHEALPGPLRRASTHVGRLPVDELLGRLPRYVEPSRKLEPLRPLQAEVHHRREVDAHAAYPTGGGMVHVPPSDERGAASSDALPKNSAMSWRRASASARPRSMRRLA